MAGGLASGRGYSPMLPMTLGGEDLRTMSWMKLNDLYKAEEEEAWVNGFSKMVNAMYAKDTGETMGAPERYLTNALWYRTATNADARTRSLTHP